MVGTRRVVSVLAGLCVLGALAGTALGQGPSEEAYKYFELNCQSCHTIGGGKLAGPDLKGLFERRDRDWLVPYILNPKAVIDSGDAYAQEIFREAKGVYMPTPPGITKDMAGKLLDVIEVESGLEESRFKGLQISDRPLTDYDLARGRRLFEGSEAFLSGAPACFSCHTLEGSGGLGGGRLGLDLTTAFARLEGRNALAAWLSAPPSAVMAPIFRETPLEGEEVLALVAYLKNAGEGGAEEAESGVLAFLLAGCGLGAVLLVLFDVLWHGRYRATRRPLVERRVTNRRLMEGSR
ncbi:MAG: c-type cytochrome [Planctomycetota bacterium]|jgi:mono/diheme cytochrome c family protein